MAIAKIYKNNQSYGESLAERMPDQENNQSYGEPLAERMPDQENNICEKLYNDLAKGFNKMADNLNSFENIDVNDINDYHAISRVFGVVSETAYNVHVSYEELLTYKKCYMQTPDCIVAMKDRSKQAFKTSHVYYYMFKAVSSVKSLRTPTSKQQAHSILSKSLDVMNKNTADLNKANANLKKYCY